MLRLPVLLLAVSLLCCSWASLLSAEPKRVLVVTTDASRIPTVWNHSSGSFVVTDLAGAGLPFDIVTHSRFVDMPLTDHDVIILNGHTSPIPVSTVYAKCQAALAEGRKVFLNGDMCYRRYDDNGNQVEYLRYSLDLFGVSPGSSGYVDGTVSIPGCIQKDPSLTDGVSWHHYTVNDFHFSSPPTYKMTFGGKVIGFLYPQGGVLEKSNPDFLMNLLDYGKIAAFLRNGRPSIVGFANDRVGGRPIASFEVHVDDSGNVPQIGMISSFAQIHDVPLTCLLIYRQLTSGTISTWNSLSNPLITIGSHSRTHPSDWPSVPDVLNETRDAIADQTVLIPRTINYFNFSGSMNPTVEQLDAVYSAGVLFGGTGYDNRAFTAPSGNVVYVQRMPTRRAWVAELARATHTPFVLSYTVASDNPVYLYGWYYPEEIQTYFGRNRKYGLYTFGQLHNYSLDPTSNRITHGIHMSVQIGLAMDYLHSQDAVFMRTEDLVQRLYDFDKGLIDCQELGGNAIQVSIYRPTGKANQVKIQARDGMVPAASGDCVVSQRMCGDMLYVDLRAETSSVFTVHFTPVAANSIANAVSVTDGSRVTVSGIVSAVFSDCCYLQQPDRIRGIKVLGDLIAYEGETLVVTGKLSTVNSERVILLD